MPGRGEASVVQAPTAPVAGRRNTVTAVPDVADASPLQSAIRNPQSVIRNPPNLPAGRGDHHRGAVHLVDPPVFHHERDLLHHRNVVERIARHGDDVGQFSGLECAELVEPAQEVGGVVDGTTEERSSKTLQLHRVYGCFEESRRYAHNHLIDHP